MACHWNDCFEMADGEMVVIHSPVTLVLGSTLLIINGSYTTNRHLIDVHQDTDIFIMLSMQKRQIYEPVHLIWQNLYTKFVLIWRPTVGKFVVLYVGAWSRF